MRRPLLFVLASALAATSALAQPSQRLLVIDQDAGYLTDTNSGAVLNVDLQAATNAAPAFEAAASSGAPFELVSGSALSPYDGKVYVSDLGYNPSGTPIPRIWAVDASGAVSTVWQGAPLVAPFALAFAPDGRLFIADAEADPSFFGNSPDGCGAYGAIFRIDTAACTGTPCAPTLLSDGSLHPFSPAIRSVLEEPVGIAWDPVRSRLYVAEACFSDLGWLGSLLAIDPSTGRVTQRISSNDQFYSLISVESRPDGTPLIVDQGSVAGDSVLWTVDVNNPDPEANATILSGGTQYSQLQDVIVDDANQVYLVDWGDYDAASQTYIAPPAIWMVDETDTDPDTNGRLVNDSVSLVTPVSGVFVPVPTAISVTPPNINGPTNVIIEGTNLIPELSLDFGPGVAFGTPDFVPGYPIGSAIQVLVTPTSSRIVPPGCETLADLTMTHPFGGSGKLPDAASIRGSDGGIRPGPPASTKGDANADGIVDGLDLAILGLHYGMTYCDDALAFDNDADFNDDDIIDGRDLARLAAYFGTRF